MERSKLGSTITHLNGGIEQGFLEIEKQENCISKEDSERLSYLQSLPQNRTEPIIHVEKPAKTKLQELIDNPPPKMLMFDYNIVLWLDKVRREVSKLK